MKKVLLVILSLILVVGLVGCGDYVPPEKTSHEVAAETNEQSVKNLIQNETLPQITKSLERENIKRRIEFINQPDRVGYLYLLSSNGQLIKEVQVLGKVSSLNSYLTPMEDIQLVDNWGTTYGVGEFPGSQRTPNAVITTEAADLDGTWGENSEGIFWFTVDGVYQEWAGLYFYSSERMTFTTQPILMEINN